MMAIRQRNAAMWQAALERVPELSWELRDEYTPIGSWIDEGDDLVGNGNMLYRILSAGVGVYKCESVARKEDWMNLRAATRIFAPKWAVAVDPDVKKMKRLKHDPIEQKAELTLAVIKEAYK